jgi:hypothetical protein
MEQSAALSVRLGFRASAVAVRQDFRSSAFGFRIYFYSDPVHSVLETAQMKLAIIKEFWNFLCAAKKWWLLPIVIALLVLGALLVFAKSSALAPFIYTLF